ncbi:MAG: hypothetical protein H6694_02230 [Candidatus Latescibacteria bacterium]|nr:hypothetical protein [Candidatus Latescibacterota bacterium]
MGSNLGHVHRFLGEPVVVAAPPVALAPLRLETPWPNPANPATTLTYSLERAAFVTLSVHDAQGRHVATLLDGFEDDGGGISACGGGSTTPAAPSRPASTW